ncbi:MAG: methyl-accepting chemotaxis protein [Fibrobacteria bacterium]|nr:methyl-accepting chemotaxis protein [Fibrobacteria bacterium]
MGIFKRIFMGNVSRKNYTIIGLPSIGIVVLIILFYQFIGIISSISDIKSVERVHTINHLLGTSYFFQYLKTDDPDHYADFKKHMEKAHSYSLLFGSILEEIKPGVKPAVVQKYDKIFTEWDHEETKDVLRLVSIFSFHPLVKTMLQLAQDFNVVSSEFLTLAKRYRLSTDKTERKEILTRIYAMQKDVDRMPNGFHSANTNLSHWVFNLVKTASWSIGLLVFIVGSFFAYRISQTIVRPITSLSRLLKHLSKGDLTMRPKIHSGDETGEMTQHLVQFLDTLHASVKTIIANANTVADAAEQLSGISSSIAHNADNMNSQTASVATAAKQASVNINTISSAAEEMSQSSSSVATAIEEMSASINDVAQNCQKEIQIVSSANSHAQNSKQIMDKLGQTANSIGKIIDVINAIAEQTNLLALNATIEAASAGESGKGFAVVANEVKELAKQTAEATHEIASQIEDMQANTSEAVKAIDQVTVVIEEVNTISQSIVSAVEQQNNSINEIARMVHEVHNGTQDVAKNVTESAEGLVHVSDTIGNVSNSVTDTSSEIKQVKISAEELAVLSGNLKGLLSQFKI